MNFVKRIKQSQMHSKTSILIIFAYCFFLDVYFFISRINSYYSKYLVVYLFRFISTTILGVYILFFFRKKNYTVLPLISVCLRIALNIYLIIYFSRFNMREDSWNKFLIYSIVIIINYCTFAFCAFFGFSKKKLLAISGIIIFLATILGYIFALEFLGWGISDEDDYILFSILLLIFGLTNNIYPLFENKKKHDDIAFLLEDLNYKLKEEMITEEEYKEQKKKIIESI